MRHAVLVAVKPDIAMDDAKEVHTSLRRAAGLIKFVQVQFILTVATQKRLTNLELLIIKKKSSRN